MEAVVTVERDSEVQGNQLQLDDVLLKIQQMPPVSKEEALEAVDAIRLHAAANGMSDMSMEEIDAIIAECRREWR